MDIRFITRHSFLPILLLIVCVPLSAQIMNQLPIRASFIQPHLFTQWDDSQWQKEFTYLKEAGMDMLIFMHTVLSSEQGRISFYPSQLEGVKGSENDLMENCLRNARLAGFKVIIGLNFDDCWWKPETWSKEWLTEQMELGNRVAAELIERYKSRYPDTMYGWYWVWEIIDSYCKDPLIRNQLVSALNINLDFLHTQTPDMPILLSPFMNSTQSTKESCAEVWQYILSHGHFKDGDIFAPQDCVGSGFLKEEEAPQWFEALSRVIPATPKIQFWGNVELFDQRFWTTATPARLKRQIDALRPYVSNFISFAYSHYYSPRSKKTIIHRAYVHYMKTGTLPDVPIPPAVNSLRREIDAGKQYLTWKAPVDKSAIMGYRVYRDGVLIDDVQPKHEEEYYRSHEIGEEKGVYVVVAYNVCGEEAPPVSVVW